MERLAYRQQRRYRLRRRQSLLSADVVNASLLRPSSTTTVCPWKGTAHYYSLHIDGADNRDAAWYYPDPKAKAENIRDRIAFWKGVEIG